MIKFVLMDIEGTTTSISFVHEVLFPYASKHLESFVRKNISAPHIIAELVAVQRTVQEEEDKTISDDEAIEQLLDWILDDRKHTALKTLQGYLWKEGYLTGEYQGHVYEDVVPVLQKWQEAGIEMGIYSSGSVEAQKLLFQYSEKGDLTPYLTAHFDTNIGHKRAIRSYQNIQAILKFPPEQILFLSDVEEELDAAKEAGFLTTQLVRPGTEASKKHLTVVNFQELRVV